MPAALQTSRATLPCASCSSACDSPSDRALRQNLAGSPYGLPVFYALIFSRVSSRDSSMRSISSSVFLLACLLASANATWAQSHPIQQSARPVESPRPAQSAPSDSAFAEARRLLQQGKYDEALSQLQGLAAKEPVLKGLSHELGVGYYKKGDYLKAVAFLKTAQEEDPNDSEAVQLMGLSYYLAGKPAEAIQIGRASCRERV